jgi:hypothetical protein
VSAAEGGISRKIEADYFLSSNSVVKVWDGNMSEYQNDSKKRESKL